jgi:hypothetical protein
MYDQAVADRSSSSFAQDITLSVSLNRASVELHPRTTMKPIVYFSNKKEVAKQPPALFVTPVLMPTT